MKQYRMFDSTDYSRKTEDHIKGLKYLPNFINNGEEQELLTIIDQQPWSCDLKRRVQHYGYKYDYRNKTIYQNEYLGTLPVWLNFLTQRLYNENIFNAQPDQVIINEYLPGQGIAPHIDCKPCFADIICSLSLGSTCLIEFSRQVFKSTILLAPRSLLILSSAARYDWRHGISARKSDNYLGTKILRSRRVSITFRKVIT